MIVFASLMTEQKETFTGSRLSSVLLCKVKIELENNTFFPCTDCCPLGRHQFRNCHKVECNWNCSFLVYTVNPWYFVCR